MSWAALEAAAGATIDGVLEESFTIVRRVSPSGDVNARRSSQGGPVSFQAVYSDRQVQRYPESRGHASSDAREFGGGLPKVDFPTTSLTFRPALDDLVTRVATGETFVISDVGSNGFTRTMLALTALTKTP